MEQAAWTAKVTGWLAQAEPRKQPSIEKLLGKKKPTRRMAGRQIGAAMRAWASRLSERR